MAKQLKLEKVKVALPLCVKLSAEESLKRTLAFDQRKEQFIAALRKSRN